MKQEIVINKSPLEAIKEIAGKHDIKRFMLVCDTSFEMLGTFEEYNKIENIAVKFNDFSPNPLYEEVCVGVKLFRIGNCDGMIAVGGGSAIDTAKCIKAFSKMSDDNLYLSQEFPENDIPFIAIPTTAGTGSESTRYAVVYYEGEKQSVTDNTLIPDYAILDARNLQTLPLYQKKCTMLDALCQGIESWWSVNATEESRAISKKAVTMIMANLNGYLNGEKESAENMMIASNLAGQAINITQTTAAHAMSYKLTSLYKIPHGRAAFVCLPYVWEYMIENADQDLKKVFEDIASALKCETPSDAVYLLKEMNRELFRKESVSVNSEDIPLLAGSVNVTRLKNNPVKLGEETLTMLYAGILGELTFSERNGGIGKKVMSFLDKCFSNYTLPPEAIAFGNLADR
nr:phosphonoacetaldehyde reductase [Lachnospiraceae bacterium]